MTIKEYEETDNALTALGAQLSDAMDSLSTLIDSIRVLADKYKKAKTAFNSINVQSDILLEATK